MLFQLQSVLPRVLKPPQLQFNPRLLLNSLRPQIPRFSIAFAFALRARGRLLKHEQPVVERDILPGPNFHGFEHRPRRRPIRRSRRKSNRPAQMRHFRPEPPPSLDGRQAVQSDDPFRQPRIRPHETALAGFPLGGRPIEIGFAKAGFDRFIHREPMIAFSRQQLRPLDVLQNTLEDDLKIRGARAVGITLEQNRLHHPSARAVPKQPQQREAIARFRAGRQKLLYSCVLHVCSAYEPRFQPRAISVASRTIALHLSR